MGGALHFGAAAKLCADNLNRQAQQLVFKLEQMRGSSKSSTLIDEDYVKKLKEALCCNKKTATAATAAAAGIGSWLGYGFPDTDIGLLGIGNHRFFLFHSAIGLQLLRTLYASWAKDRGSVPDPNVADRIAAAALSALSFGVGLHLLVDVFQPKSVIFPFIGSLVDGTLIDDNVWLLLNSVWAFKTGLELLPLAVGKTESDNFAKRGFSNDKNGKVDERNLVPDTV